MFGYEDDLKDKIYHMQLEVDRLRRENKKLKEVAEAAKKILKDGGYEYDPTELEKALENLEQK